MPRIVITGATGKLGSSAVKHLQRVTASEIAGLVRSSAKAEGLVRLGVEVSEGDYEDPDSQVRAFAEVERLLVISSGGHDY